MKLLLASRNVHKAAEITSISNGLPIEWLSLRAFPDIAEVEEDGATLEENAAKKALTPARATGLWTLADDSGLEVEALGGLPGVHSARFAGPGCDYAANNAKLLEALAGAPPERRRAAFRCVLALASPDGRVLLEEGRVDGVITDSPRGQGGFGYDPVFLVPEAGKTLAEMTPKEKNVVSHRFRALNLIRPRLEQLSAGSGAAPGTSAARRAGRCAACGLELDAWRCRQPCPGCGCQFDCGDPP